MEDAPKDGEEGAATRKGSSPTRINEGDERTGDGRFVYEASALGSIEVDENADGGIEGLAVGIGEEA